MISKNITSRLKLTWYGVKIDIRLISMFVVNMLFNTYLLRC